MADPCITTDRPHTGRKFPMRSSDSTEAPANGHADVFKLLAGAVQEHLSLAVDKDTVEQIVDEKIAEARLPRQIEVKCDGKSAITLKSRAHRQFDDLIDLVNEGHGNLLMVGPAGTGKTTLAKSLAEALGRPFGFLSLSAGVSETHLFGRTLPQKDGTWGYVPSQFITLYETGGVFLLDEMDAADANVMVAINAALANGVCANPNGQIHVRHADTLILGACNTWGRGADQQYVGRNPLDAATLDRFVLATLKVEYDTDLERDIAQSMLPEGEAETLLYFVNSLRESISRNRLRRVASTRLVVNASKAMKSGKTLSQVKDRYFQDWSVDEKAKVSL
jgi:midasin (ATPase involved in ribosome maturation)